MKARSPLDAIRLFHEELTAIRRDLHANPELGFEEVRTSGIVAGALEALGIEVHRVLLLEAKWIDACVWP